MLVLDVLPIRIAPDGPTRRDITFAQWLACLRSPRVEQACDFEAQMHCQSVISVPEVGASNLLNPVQTVVHRSAMKMQLFHSALNVTCIVEKCFQRRHKRVVLAILVLEERCKAGMQAAS